MGLQSQLNDFSTDSLPLFFLSLLATFFSHLRSFLLPFPDPRLSSPLSHHLHLNRLFSFSYGHADDEDAALSPASDCVVCLCPLSPGHHVRRLPCRHVFHKHCFDAWLHHLNFNCPLCRSPLPLDQRVPFTRRLLPP